MCSVHGGVRGNQEWYDPTVHVVNGSLFGLKEGVGTVVGVLGGDKEQPKGPDISNKAFVGTQFKRSLLGQTLTVDKGRPWSRE